MPRQKRHNRSEELVEATIEVFDEKGYGPASMQDVADRVGILKGSLYHYTDSKEGLLFRVFETATEQTFALLDQISERPDPAVDRLADFVRAWSLWYLENLATIGIYLSEWKHLQGERLEQAVSTRRVAYEKVLRLVEETKEEGEAGAGLDCRYASLLILSAINGLPNWYRPGRSESPAEVAEIYGRLLVGMVRRGDGPAPMSDAAEAALAEMIVPLPAAAADGSDRKAAVLGAATEVFSEKGYAGASMRDVADRIEMNKGSLYHYIKSKEGLLAQILEESTERTFALLTEIEALPEPAIGRLRAFICSWSRWYMLNLGVISIYTEEWSNLEGERRRTALGTRRTAYRRVAALVEEVQAEGEAAADLDPRYASLLILSAINGLPGWYRPGPGEPPEHVAENYAGLLVSMVAG